MANGAPKKIMMDIRKSDAGQKIPEKSQKPKEKKTIEESKGKFFEEQLRIQREKIKETEKSADKHFKKHLPKSEIFNKAEEKILEKELKKIDAEVEHFEKQEEEWFKKEEETKKRKKIISRLSRTPLWVYISSAILLLALASAAYVAIEILPKAEIKITTKKTNWDYINPIIAGKNITKPDIIQKQIPAEVFSVKKNGTFSFPATGKKYIERKATGKIVIYNSFSSAPQKLVAGTRFSAPDGKIFRLNETITVPGATIVDGKIAPSSIKTSIGADKAGTEYNIGPISRFTIPGFQGTPKYEGFYAQSKDVMKGGFVGESAFPTETDIKNAKEKSLANIKEYIKSYISLQMPADFKTIEGNSQFNVLKQEVNSEVDEKGSFTVFTDAEQLNLVFKESDALDLIEETAKSALGPNFRIKDYKMDYGFAKVDLKGGQISFAVDFRGVLEEPFDVAPFKQKILGEKEENLKNLISSFPNVQKATISFWPFWVKTVPDDIDKVSIKID
mgnify:CR=1 FL=1